MTTKSRLLLIELQIAAPTVVSLFVGNSTELNGAYKQIIKFARAPGRKFCMGACESCFGRLSKLILMVDSSELSKNEYEKLEFIC